MIRFGGEGSWYPYFSDSGYMSLPSHPVMTEDEFERQFDALVAEVLRHGVDIEGFWSCGSPPEPSTRPKSHE